jgi:hypothetical protein
MPKLTDTQIKAQIGGLLDKLVTVCNKNNYAPNSPEFNQAWIEHFGLPLLLLCEGDVDRVEKLKNEYGKEHNLIIPK